MAHAPSLKRDPAVAAIVRSWRELTGGLSRTIHVDRRRTMVACSAGADSSALAIALAAASRDLIIAHVVHDLRPERESLEDRDAARELASRLGLPFAEARVSARARTGNLEARARRARYAALERMAHEHRCGFIATAHHADDQLETMLMAIARGAGPRGLGGVHESRALGASIVIRPMLGSTRADAEGICHAAGWAWREDASNADTTRLRARIRAEIMPALRAARPGVSRRAARAAGLLRDAAELTKAAAASIPRVDEPGAVRWARRELREQPELVIGQALRDAAAALADGRGLDRLGAATLDRAIRAIRDDSEHPRRFVWHGMTLMVTGLSVTMRVQ